MGGSRRRFIGSLTVAVGLLFGAVACGGKLSEEEIRVASGATPSTLADLAPQGPNAIGDVVEPSSEQAQGTAGPEVEEETGAVPHGGTTTGEPGVAQQGAACHTGERGPLVIATIGNFSGVVGAALAPAAVGVQVWAAHMNSLGGLCGRQVQVIVEDDGGDNARYYSLAQDIVQNRGAVAVVSAMAVLSGTGAVRFHNDSHVPMIGNEGSFDGYYTSPYIAPTFPEIDLSQAASGHMAVDVTGKKRIGFIILNDTPAGARFATAFTKGVQDAGGTVVAPLFASIAQLDFTAECQQLRKAGAEAVHVLLDAPGLTRVAKSCDRQNYFPDYTGSAQLVNDATFKEPSLSRMTGALYTFPYRGASSPSIDEYRAAYDRFRSGQPEGGATSLGWANAKLFEEIATRAANMSGEINAETLVQAMYTLKDWDGAGLQTPMTYTAQGARGRLCYFAMRGDGKGSFASVVGSEYVCP